MGLAASGLYGDSAIGDCPAAGTGLLCCTVIAAGAGCEFVTSSIAPFLQNAVDSVGLSRYVEMRDLLSDVIYVLCKLDMRGSGPCKIPNFPSGDGCVPSGLTVRQSPIGVGQHWGIRWVTLIHLIGLCRELSTILTLRCQDLRTNLCL